VDNFIIYGIRISPEHIEDLELFFKKTEELFRIKLIDMNYLVGMKPKECLSLQSNLHEFDLTKIDFKQLEKKILNILSEAKVTTDFLKFNLYTGTLL
jgi:hypothetical protein